MRKARAGFTDPAGSLGEQPRGVRTSALRSVMSYAVLATIWIFTSDIITGWFAISARWITTVSIIKGIAFVWVTSTLLFILVRNDLRHINSALVQQRLIAKGASALRQAESAEQAWDYLAEVIRKEVGYEDVEVWRVQGDGAGARLTPAANVATIDNSGAATDLDSPTRAVSEADASFKWMWDSEQAALVPVRRIAPSAGVAHPAGYSSLDVVPVRAEGVLAGAILLWSNQRKRMATLYADPVGHLVAQLSDTLERMHLRDDLERSFLYDDLTQLPNRTLLIDRLRATIRDASALDEDFLVLVCQIDLYERIQQSLGHEQADRLIAEAAQRLTTIIGERDTIAHTQPNEFTIVARFANRSEVADYLARLQAAASNPIDLDGGSVPLSISTGVYVARGEAPVEKVLSDVSAALRRAHELGRGRTVFFDEGMRLTVDDALSVEVDMREALNSGQFEVVYQPIVSSDSQAPLGAEALVRWRHPKHGLMSPANFIPVAEDSGLIVDIGRQVLRTACIQCARWPQFNGINPSISVNLSAIEFLDPDLEMHVASILATSGLEPKRLMLEITETTLMLDPAAARETLSRLRALGVRIAVDDFGTGYSSLAYLQQFELDMLKIDASFVAGIPCTGENCAIASAIVQMAHALGLRTTAEGVETEEQASYLAAQECDLLQGYLFSRPLAEPEFLDWVSTGRD